MNGCEVREARAQHLLGANSEDLFNVNCEYMAMVRGPLVMSRVHAEYLIEKSLHGLEAGGLLVGTDEPDGSVMARAFVFPDLTSSSSVFCEFDGRDIVILAGALRENLPNRVVAWVHTHPGHGLHPSSTDLGTMQILAHLEPRILSIIVDGSHPAGIAAWRLDFSLGPAGISLANNLLTDGADPDIIEHLVTVPIQIRGDILDNATSGVLDTGEPQGRRRLMESIRNRFAEARRELDDLF